MVSHHNKRMLSLTVQVGMFSIFSYLAQYFRPISVILGEVINLKKDEKNCISNLRCRHGRTDQRRAPVQSSTLSGS